MGIFKKRDSIPQSVMALLTKFDDVTLAKIACEINSWEFPEELKSLHPSLHATYSKNKVYRDLVYLTHNKLPLEEKECSDFFEKTLSPIRIYITQTIGERLVSKYWNCTMATGEHKMTDEQFNIWWNSDKNLNRPQ